MDGLSGPIYKESVSRQARETRRPKDDYRAVLMPRFSGWLIKDKDPLRYAASHAKLMADDVMVGFRNSRG